MGGSFNSDSKERANFMGAHSFGDDTHIRFFLEDERPVKEVPKPQVERHLTQHEIDARPQKLKRSVLKRLRCRFISKALLRVDSY